MINIRHLLVVKERKIAPTDLIITARTQNPSGMTAAPASAGETTLHRRTVEIAITDATKRMSLFGDQQAMPSDPVGRVLTEQGGIGQVVGREHIEFRSRWRVFLVQ